MQTQEGNSPECPKFTINVIVKVLRDKYNKMKQMTLPHILVIKGC
jgi:hypothetical protein